MALPAARLCAVSKLPGPYSISTLCTQGGGQRWKEGEGGEGVRGQQQWPVDFVTEALHSPGLQGLASWLAGYCTRYRILLSAFVGWGQLAPPHFFFFFHTF